MKVLVGMSGGVDSSVAALLLKEQGFEVSGAIMTHWGTGKIFDRIKEKFDNNVYRQTTHSCCLSPNENENVENTKKVADKLGIELHVIDCSKEYEKEVIDYFRDEYLKGRTPNPCVQCNRYIKFGVFPKLAKQSGIEFDKFATGHYAKIEFENGRYILKRGKNLKKDQSYFLYGLNQEQLSNIILPLGDYSKEEIREIARKYGLEVADKPDSQDFYSGDYNDILDSAQKKGNIIDKNGKILGVHDGFWNYTIGQRKGIGIAAAAPLYVIELRKDTNEVVVGYKEDAVNVGLIAGDVNFNAIERLSSSLKCKVKIRSSQEPKSAVIMPIENGKVEVRFDEVQNPIAKGQSAVFYNDDIVLGGGVIEEVL